MIIKDESLFATSICWKHGGKRTYNCSLSSKSLTVSYKIKQMTFKRFILLSLHYFSEQSGWDNIAYMVFQKIEHDLERWRNMDEEIQELWIGRSKGTGLLLGTLSKNEDRKLAADLYSYKFVQQAARKNGRSYMINRKALKGSSLIPAKLSLKVFS